MYTTIAIFLANTNVIILIGQVKRRGTILEIESLETTGQTFVILKAATGRPVVGRARNLRYFDFELTDSGSGAAKIEVQRCSGGITRSQFIVNYKRTELST